MRCGGGGVMCVCGVWRCDVCVWCVEVYGGGGM